MAAEPRNLVVVLSDEHASKMLGCHGHPLVRTPCLDRFAAQGTRFANAYTNSPLCMPARASLATGQYPHQTGYWCNALPYDGRPDSWGHRLRAEGIPVTSIGKLHYKNGDLDTGFDEQIVPMHALDGVGDLLGAIRHKTPLPRREGSKMIATEIGRGESRYTHYDRDITERSIAWLTDAAANRTGPWVLFVGMVAPHFPLIAPAEFYDLYPPDEMPLPKACRPEDWPPHPWFDEFRKSFVTNTFFDNERRRMAVSAYLGLCSFVDRNFGRIVDCIDALGLGDTTRVVYTSDHGDNLGARGLWQKSTFYEESAAVPLIMRGEGVGEGRVVDMPVSLIDIFPTVLDCVGCPDKDGPRNGRSLIDIGAEPYDPGRTVFAEYHGAGAATAAFMLRRGRFKYIHYVDYPPQLFDLKDDPEELRDLAADPGYAGVLDEFSDRLCQYVDPVATDRRAKADQAALIAAQGGPEAVLRRGSFGATPPPGAEPAVML